MGCILGKNILTKKELATALQSKGSTPSKMKPQKKDPTPAEIKMLQNEVKALWEAHSHLLIELNRLKDEQNDCTH